MERAVNSARIGIVAVGGDAFRFVTNGVDRLLEEGRGGWQIACFTEHGIDQIAVAVDCPIQIMPAFVDFQVCFVDVP